MKKLKIFAGILLLSGILLGIFSTSVTAAPNMGLRVYSEGGYLGDESEVFAPEESPNRMHISMTPANSMFRGDVTQSYNRTIGDINLFYAYITDRSRLVYNRAEFSINVQSDTTGYDLLQFGMCLFGSNVDELRTTITITTDRREYTSSLYISTTRWNLVNIDISELYGNVSRISVRAELSEDAYCTSMYVSTPYVSRDVSAGFVRYEKYLAGSFESLYGDADAEYGRVTPDIRGRAYFSAVLGAIDQPLIGSRAYFEIVAGGYRTGSVRVGLKYAGDEEYEYLPRISLNENDTVVTVPFTVRGEIVGYTVEYDDMHSYETFDLYAVKLYTIDESAAIVPREEIGTVDSITREGNKVVFRGGIDRNAVSEYSNAVIRFCALPTATDDLQDAVDLGGIKITTMFEYTVDLDEKPVVADTYLFFVAIVIPGGEMIPISFPRYTDAGEISESDVSTLGLYGSMLAGVFESNASHVILDVPMDTLIAANTASTSVADSYTVYDGDATIHTIRFNRSVLTELDRDVQFYISAGIKVYLRLVSKTPMDGVTYLGEAENYAVHLTDNVSRSRYAAVVRFLSGRYDTAEGFVLGVSVNDAEYIGNADLLDLVSYVNELADLCRITYNAASVNMPDVLVVVPFGVGDSNQNTEDGTWVSERTVGVMLADRLAHIGEIPFVPMFSIENSEDRPYAATYLWHAADRMNLAFPADIMIQYTPSEMYLWREYENYRRSVDVDLEASDAAYAAFIAGEFFAFCDECEEFGPRAVFLSTSGLRSGYDQKLYSALKTYGGDNSERYVAEFDAVERPAEVDAVQYTLWDFSDKHYSLGWITGGVSSNCRTVYSERFTEYYNSPTRVLRSEYEIQRDEEGTPLGVSGIMLRNFSKTLDLSGTRSVRFRFALSAEDGAEDQDVSVVFVIGSDEKRAEYTALHVTLGEIHEYACDLSMYEYADSIRFMGIMVYASGNVALELSSVSADSHVLTAAELEASFSEEETNTDEAKTDMRFAALIVGIVVFLTVIIGIVLTKKNAKNRKSAGAQKWYPDGSEAENMKNEDKKREYDAKSEKWKSSIPEDARGVKLPGKYQIAELIICLVAVVLGILYLKWRLVPLSVLLPLYTAGFAGITALRFCALRAKGEKRFVAHIPAIGWIILTVAVLLATALYFVGA